MSRKLIRPSLDRPRDPLPALAPRRAAPPEGTNAETSYLRQALSTRSVLVVRLLGGGELRGRLEGYDRDCLRLQPEGESAILIRKGRVKYYWVERVPGGS